MTAASLTTKYATVAEIAPLGKTNCPPAIVFEEVKMAILYISFDFDFLSFNLNRFHDYVVVTWFRRWNDRWG